MKIRVSRKTFLHALIIMALDALIVGACCFTAMLVRFGFVWDDIPERYLNYFVQYYPFQCLFTFIIFWFSGMYVMVWKSISLSELIRIAGWSALCILITTFLRRLFTPRMPISVDVMAALMQFLCFCILRCMPRFLDYLKRYSHRTKTQERILLVGAGSAAKMLMNDLAREDKSIVVAVIDDDSEKRGRYLNGVRIVGGREAIPEAVKQYDIDKIVFAISSASETERKDILTICSETGLPVRVLPPLSSFMENESAMHQLREIRIEDLLGRKPVTLDKDKIAAFIRGKTVLVTGGGGSIGSELCRQIASRHPKKLVILDISENYSYMLEHELRQQYGASLDVQVEICSVRDKKKTEEVIFRYKPELVLHAAAHKHVPLMEHNPEEAVKNNIFGTYHVIRACEKVGVKKLVLISTDKAVNPTNFMGATKRFTEMLLMARPESSTSMSAVRFGNVLGSNGSVIPIFKEQIAAGGPVTITDKRIIRYFMTIPEAAQLVLETAAIAGNKQIFVLDMGEPVRILDLAENLIRLSGYEPYADIRIVETGLRPGEKLYEELLTKNRELIDTSNENIFIELPEKIGTELMFSHLRKLDEAVTNEAGAGELIALLKTMVPTYHDPAEVNAEAAKKLENK